CLEYSVCASEMFGVVCGNFRIPRSVQRLSAASMLYYAPSGLIHNEGDAMTADDAIANDQRYILQTYQRPNFVIERGEGCYLFDTEGRRYLDCVSGIAVNALGYGDEQVAKAIAEHATQLIHTSNLYYTRSGGELAKLLVEHSFADRVFFSNSGA